MIQSMLQDLQLNTNTIMLFHLFLIIGNQSIMLNYLYAIFIIINIFSFTSVLDHKKYIIVVDFLKVNFLFGILIYQNFSWFGLNNVFTILVSFYFIVSFLFNCYFYYTENISTKVVFK